MEFEEECRPRRRSECGRPRSNGFLEAFIAMPFVVANGIFRVAQRCAMVAFEELFMTGENGGREHEHECEHERHEHVPVCSTADLRIEARSGDTRHKVILVENNSPQPATVTMEADPWMDSAGNQVGGTITFEPALLTLAHCEAAQTVATISVATPLAPGTTYYTRMYLRGTARRPISVELRVAPARQIDYYAQADPCRPGCGHFVEFCHESGCGDPHCPKCHPQRRRSGFSEGRRFRRDDWSDWFFLSPMFGSRASR